MSRKDLSKFSPKDDEWILKNFGSLVSKYPGQYAAVANEELFIASAREAVEKAAQKKYPKALPSVMKIPRPESLTCVL